MSKAQLGTVLHVICDLAGPQGMQEVSDSELVRRFRVSQDETAFTALFHRHARMVWGVCRDVLRHEQDAEDAFQATFLALARHAASIRKGDAVASWLHGTARRIALAARRAATTRQAHERRWRHVPLETPMSEEALREALGMLDDEVQALPERHRAVFVLCCLEGKSRAEAARALGWKEGTVASTLARAREQLQRRLTRRGVTLSSMLCAVVLRRQAKAAAPAILSRSTIQAALSYAAGNEVSDLVCKAVIELAKGATTTMITTKLKTVTVSLLALALSAAGIGALAYREVAAQATAPPVEERQPQAKEPSAARKGDTTPTTNGAKDLADQVEVRGQVLDPDGKPMEGAKLYLGRAATLLSRGDDPAPSQQATSGADGRFRFPVSPSDLARSDDGKPLLQVMAVADGLGCDWAAIGPAVEELTLRLVKDAPIRGRILDAEGKPVNGAKLTVTAIFGAKGDDLGTYLEAVRKREPQNAQHALTKLWHGPLPGPGAVVTTGADGRFRLAGAGRERIVNYHVEGPGIASSSLRAMTRVAETVMDGGGQLYGASFDYVGRASRPIRGVVRDKETGNPLAGVSVGGGDGGRPALTGQDGRYELLGLAKGPRYRLTVKPADGRYIGQYVQSADTEGLGALTCDIELTRVLTVRGRVTDKATGKPIAQARVEYHPLGGNGYAEVFAAESRPVGETITAADGSYALAVLPGQGVICVAAPRREAYMPALVKPKELKDFFKKPLAWDHTEYSLVTCTGRNSYSGISQNFYNALVLLEPGEKEEGLVKDVALQRPLERKGRVVGPDDKPLTGVTVCGLTRQGVETLKGSEFIVRGINPKANRPLVFCHKEKKLGFYIKELSGDSVEPLMVKLEPCGSASGRTVDRDGQPLAGLHLQVWGQALLTPGEAGGGRQLVITDKEGRFRAEGLVPGQDYQISEVRPRGRLSIINKSVRVEPGKHEDLGEIKADAGQ